MAEMLPAASHRPWPLPARPWVMRHTWHDLMFAHWPLSVDYLRAFVPPELELDSFNGNAWLAVAPFWMSGIRLRGLPALPGISSFPELNVRTYVKGPSGSASQSPSAGKPGVYFFSLDAGNALAVAAARAWYRLPYLNAEMKVQLAGDEVNYSSRRCSPSTPAEVVCRYQPIGKGSQIKTPLENFLTERYCLYAVAGKGRLLRGEIHHASWTLQSAEAHWEVNTVTQSYGIVLPPLPPLLHFSKRLDVFVWAPERVR